MGLVDIKAGCNSGELEIIAMLNLFHFYPISLEILKCMEDSQ